MSIIPATGVTDLSSGLGALHQWCAAPSGRGVTSAVFKAPNITMTCFKAPEGAGPHDELILTMSESEAAGANSSGTEIRARYAPYSECVPNKVELKIDTRRPKHSAVSGECDGRQQRGGNKISGPAMEEQQRHSWLRIVRRPEQPFRPEADRPRWSCRRADLQFFE